MQIIPPLGSERQPLEEPDCYEHAFYDDGQFDVENLFDTIIRVARAYRKAEGNVHNEDFQDEIYGLSPAFVDDFVKFVARHATHMDFEEEGHPKLAVCDEPNCACHDD